MRRLPFAALALVALVASSCATTKVDVSTTSYVDPARPVDRTKVVAISGLEGEVDLARADVGRLLARRLGFAGTPVGTAKGAEYLLAWEASIDQGRDVNYAYTVPVYGQVGGGTTSVSGSVYGRGGYSNFSGTAHTAPQFGVVGSESYAGTYRIFTRRIAVALYASAEAANPEHARPLWQATATSAGTNPELRTVLPHMIEATLSLYGLDSGGVKQSSYPLKHGAPQFEWSGESVAPQS